MPPALTSIHDTTAASILRCADQTTPLLTANRTIAPATLPRGVRLLVLRPAHPRGWQTSDRTQGLLEEAGVLSTSPLRQGLELRLNARQPMTIQSTELSSGCHLGAKPGLAFLVQGTEMIVGHIPASCDHEEQLVVRSATMPAECCAANRLQQLVLAPPRNSGTQMFGVSVVIETLPVSQLACLQICKMPPVGPLLHHIFKITNCPWSLKLVDMRHTPSCCD